MEFLLLNDGRIVKAKSMLQALEISGYEQIYWQGNRPYAMSWGIYPKKIFAIKKPKNAIWK